MHAYGEESRVRSVLPRDEATHAALLRLLLLEKCVYELLYERNNGPNWAFIPVP